MVSIIGLVSGMAKNVTPTAVWTEEAGSWKLRNVAEDTDNESWMSYRQAFAALPVAALATMET